MSNTPYITLQATSIKNEIQNLSTTPSQPASICVASKYASPTEIEQLYNIGFRQFGENKLQDALHKQSLLKHLTDIHWHFIGHLQTNKVKKAVTHFQTIQSIDSLKLLKKINDISIQLNKKTSAFIQVNSGKDPKKHGFLIEEVHEMEHEIFSFSNVSVQGIMVMAPYLNNENELRSIFKTSYELFEFLKKTHHITELSMGMSNDYQLAIQEGATMVRIGRKLFKEE